MGACEQCIISNRKCDTLGIQIVLYYSTNTKLNNFKSECKEECKLHNNIAERV